MTDLVYYIICGVLTVGVLVGIALMSKVKLAPTGNRLSAVCMAAAIGVTLYKNEILADWMLWAAMAAGLVAGLIWAKRIKMIEMPEVVALFNGFGGAASALVAFISVVGHQSTGKFALATGGLALAIGVITFVGSAVAAGKLHKIISQRPVVFKGHSTITTLSLLITAVTVVLITFEVSILVSCILCAVFSAVFGYAFSIRVGGADMPITISLLNSFSGVAGAIAGMAIGDPLLIAIGGVVGASGLLLTQIMCKAMNRHLMDILLGKTSVSGKAKKAEEKKEEKAEENTAAAMEEPVKEKSPAEILNEAKKVIIIPGYGMALAQAQHLVKQLSDKLEAKGAEVKFAIHPVAGRMPGHMNVLLCEADVPYEKLYEMDDINPEFAETDAVVIIGANDVVNPAAKEAEGTPIYGMPVLDADKAKHVIICNYDLKPGYAGVENPLYSKEEGVTLLLGDACETLGKLLKDMDAKPESVADDKKSEEKQEEEYIKVINEAKKVIIIPGYGMALAQAQHLVKQLSDKLENNGAEVKFAIHPVAGRMPGHMNVLLCEADVPYEKLYEMDDINPEFSETDAVIIIGANDVVNPAAKEAEGTPIYGMPVLDADKAKHVIICNYDLKPGYAGVENPLYSKNEGVTLLLGDANDTLQKLISAIGKTAGEENVSGEKEAEKETPSKILSEAKKVIIIPGYGMALAQAQHLVKQLSDKLEANGAEVKFAIHPVAGRMPGHMNVLLCEADVPYEKLYEMDDINPEFAEADAVVIIGANDVVNPAAREAEGTPIYGMPVLNADKAKHVIICNYDLKPGYAGVENPLYTKETGVTLLLGDACETLKELISSF